MLLIAIAVQFVIAGIKIAFPLDRSNIMSDWDFATVALILVGCSIIAAGIIIAAMLLGFLRSSSQFLLLTTIILIVMGDCSGPVC